MAKSRMRTCGVLCIHCIKISHLLYEKLTEDYGMLGKKSSDVVVIMDDSDKSEPRTQCHKNMLIGMVV